MHDSTVTTPGSAASDELVMRWTPVTDEQGRTRMVATWTQAGAPKPSSIHHAA